MSCPRLQCSVKGNLMPAIQRGCKLHMMCRAALVPKAGYTMPAPGSSLDASLKHIGALPVQEAPAVFGLHPNANINLQLQVCRFVPPAVSLCITDPFIAFLLSITGFANAHAQSAMCTGRLLSV